MKLRFLLGRPYDLKALSGGCYSLLKRKDSKQCQIQNDMAILLARELSREIEPEGETAYLLKSENMKRRLLEAKNREEGISFDEACKKLGIS